MGAMQATKCERLIFEVMQPTGFFSYRGPEA
jgi:hypothetical protein